MIEADPGFMAFVDDRLDELIAAVREQEPTTPQLTGFLLEPANWPYSQQDLMWQMALGFATALQRLAHDR